MSQEPQAKRQKVYMTNSATASAPRIGVLALQGAFREHVRILKELGAEVTEIREAEQLEGVDAVVLPGGESTAMSIIAGCQKGSNKRPPIFQALRNKMEAGTPMWGTCAGMILLSDKCTGQKDGGQALVGGLDVCVHRNFFGSQVSSFETELEAPPLKGSTKTAPFTGIFIRAPGIGMLRLLVSVYRLLFLSKANLMHNVHRM